MSDSITVELLPDGTIVCVELDLRCKPPGTWEIRSDGPTEAYIALFLAGRPLTPELMEQMIDFYEFAQKAMGGMRIVIGTG